VGCRIIVGRDDEGTGSECACFYDSVTDTCFGIKLNDLEEAESFQKSIKKDLRTLTHKEFETLLNMFREERKLNKEGKNPKVHISY
jgi:hypothetical protein